MSKSFDFPVKSKIQDGGTEANSYISPKGNQNLNIFLRILKTNFSKKV